MRKLFVRLFISILSVALFVIFFIIFFIGVFYFRSANQWSKNSFNEFSQRLSLSLTQSNSSFNLTNLVATSLDSALEDNRISGLLFRNEEGEVVYSFGKTQVGDLLTQRSEPLDIEIDNKHLAVGDHQSNSFKTVVTKSPISLIQTRQSGDSFRVDLIEITDSKSMFDKRLIEVPSGVEPKSITGSIVIMDEEKYAYAIDVLVFSPLTYKYSKDLFSVGMVWLVSVILIALQFSLVLSYRFSRQLEIYAKGLRQALFKLSRGEENVTLPKYNVEEYEEINRAVQLLDEDLSQNRKNRKAWLRNITHDLNTPITSMQILFDGIEDKVFPLNNETMALLKKENADLSGRIKRITLYASLQSPDKEIEFSSSTTDDIISAISKSLKDIHRVDFIKRDKKVVADFSSIVLASLCLIENAIEYGTGIVVVEIYEKKIKVTNKGFLKTDLAVFEPWERGDESRTKGGNGLGLPIAYEVMRLHGGEITLNQKEDYVIALLKW